MVVTTVARTIVENDQVKQDFSVALQFIEEVTANCREVQKKVLAEILNQNAETEYLKRHGLNGATDKDTFKSKIPVVEHQDIKSDIQRIAHGDFSPILCSQPISEFFISSGTSAGESKLIPSTAEEMGRRMKLSSLLTPIIDKYMPGLDKGKVLEFQFTKPEIRTPGGLIARPITSSLYKSPCFLNRPFDPYNNFTCPDEVILCTDSSQSMYVQMLCSLYNRLEVLRMGSTFPPGLLRAIKFLQTHYSNLCHDISNGTLDSRITDESLRACLSKIMRPDLELASSIDRVCREDNWEGIIKRIWPNTKYLSVIVTGSMAQYIPALDYYSGGLPKVSTMYGSSECFCGLNLKPFGDPMDISYTIFPNMAYLEFIPLEDQTCLTQDSMPQLVDLADVEVGKEYEIVVTTYTGLYRYRVGDVLCATGFYNSAPQFKYTRRKNLLLSIDLDKTDEVDLQKAIKNASVILQSFNTSIIEYTSFADTKSIPGHYVIYLELLIKDSMKEPSPEVLEQCCLEMEEALNSIYREGRVANRTIGPLEIRVVKSGTFEKLMDRVISSGASISQYKVPKCVSSMHMIELLDSRVVSTHFSPSLPHWSSEHGV